MHSRYRRMLTDVPVGGRPTRIVLRVRRFFCANAECEVQTFRRTGPFADPTVVAGQRRAAGDGGCDRAGAGAGAGAGGAGRRAAGGGTRYADQPPPAAASGQGAARSSAREGRGARGR
ncbi:transposase family protein [Dactylosporangium matsuzakiense]|nr:transposase family protein [Dactylosporangium matsuzakiense]